MKILVESDQVETRSGVSARNNRPYSITTQAIRVMLDFIRGPARITLVDGQAPYPVGEYEIDLESSVRIAGFGELELSRNLVIKPVRVSPAIAPVRTGTTG